MKTRYIATWVGTDNIFFCYWGAETGEDVMITLSENGMYESLITVACTIFRHINQNECSVRYPYKLWADIGV